LYAKIQEFIQHIITKQVKEEKRLEEDFPSMGLGDYEKSNIIDKIKNDNKKKKEQQSLFTPSKSVVPTFARDQQSHTSVFNVDNRQASQRDLVSLHQEF
jgi:hypothetical protein